MSIYKSNIITHGASGKLGNEIVFRIRNGKTHMMKFPKKSSVPASEAQQGTRTNFQLATIYGKAAMAEPEIKSAYAEKKTDSLTAYNVAIADFFHAPKIDSVDLTNYTGAIGSTIRITVTDDFKVMEVIVKIENQDGTLVEETAAVQVNDLTWLFTATVHNESLTLDRITITATDMPDNKTSMEEVLS